MTGVTPAWMLTTGSYCSSGKVLYGSEERAWSAAATLVEKRGHSDLKVYHCRTCRYFHLTTAKVQLHDFFWKPTSQWRKGVKNWFHERGTIDQWDMEGL